MVRSGSRSRVVSCAAIALVGAVACTTPLTVEEERSLGTTFEKQIREEVKLVRDDTLVRYVRDLGRQIVRASGPQPFEYHFYVVDDAENINAFAGPAGHIYIHTRTLLEANNVSELAGVMAHEVGHVARRHIANNYRRQQSTGLLFGLGVVAAAALGGPGAAEIANVGGGLAAAAYLNSFGRDAEREADAFAVETMPRAGYHPNGLVSFFETLKRESGGSPPAFLSSHPATAERIENTRALIARTRLPSGLRTTDGGRLESMQQRIRKL